MINLARSAEAVRQYADAYAMHYQSKDLRVAMTLYKEIMDRFPGTPEAKYARTQIENIVSQVVSSQELLEAEMNLATSYFDSS